MANLRARQLRNTMTPQEIKLWCQLRYFNERGFHFRRQAPIGPFIIDFAEKTQRLAIEVDGTQHGFDDGQRRDARRDAVLRLRGYRVLRFWNADVDTNMDGVINAVTAALAEKTPPVTLRVTPSPLREEG
jgi:very-short-patch-repair endonuclease